MIAKNKKEITITFRFEHCAQEFLKFKYDDRNIANAGCFTDVLEIYGKHNGPLGRL